MKHRTAAYRAGAKQLESTAVRPPDCLVMHAHVTRSDQDIDDAAQIWVEATAARDGDDEVAGLEDSRPIIQGVLDRSPRSLLLLARTADGAAAGFAAVEPAEGTDPRLAQLSYFGVSPRMWGQGIGERLMRELPAVLATAGFARARLSVYVDNGRATSLYQRLGWRSAGEPTPHPRTRKPEQRYELVL